MIRKFLPPILLLVASAIVYLNFRLFLKPEQVGDVDEWIFGATVAFAGVNLIPTVGTMFGMKGNEAIKMATLLTFMWLMIFIPPVAAWILFAFIAILTLTATWIFVQFLWDHLPWCRSGFKVYLP